MGRPSKLDDEETLERFFTALNAGLPPEVAARYGGFSPASLYRFKRGSTARHATFRVRFDQSLAGLEMRLAGTVLKAAQTDPRWAMALLERRFPKRWARQQIDGVEDSLDGAHPAPEAPVVLDPALMAVLVPRLLEAGRQLSGRPKLTESDVSAFEDDGSERQDTDEEAAS